MFARSAQRMKERVPFRNVRQRRRSRGRIVQLKQTHYEPKTDCSGKLPVSILGTGVLRRLVQSSRSEAEDLLRQIDWDKYRTGVSGVRWHSMGGFMVQFKRRRLDKNFVVSCKCFFRVGLYGFEEAKRRAIAYRKRLEQEWREQEMIWRILDTKKEIRKYKEMRAAEQTSSTASGFSPPSPSGSGSSSSTSCSSSTSTHLSLSSAGGGRTPSSSSTSITRALRSRRHRQSAAGTGADPGHENQYEGEAAPHPQHSAFALRSSTPDLFGSPSRSQRAAAQNRTTIPADSGAEAADQQQQQHGSKTRSGARMGGGVSANTANPDSVHYEASANNDLRPPTHEEMVEMTKSQDEVDNYMSRRTKFGWKGRRTNKVQVGAT